MPPLPSPDPAGDAAGTRPTPFEGAHDERLRVPAWWWLLGVALIGLLGYEVQLALHQGSLSWIAYVVLTPLVFWGLWSMGRTRVRVADGELWAHNAHLPIGVIDRAAVIPAAAKSAALGRQLDPAAFLVHKFWVKTMVLLVLDDPDDPTPYWLVSTRHPESWWPPWDYQTRPPKPRTRGSRTRRKSAPSATPRSRTALCQAQSTQIRELPFSVASRLRW
ncbi:DUF3093 domain-containing protein [Williamsia sp. DF01-3]|uniref:DUF3093 domain-containing protein n=1 Tax=Williamsia sp. DF01-3 TaxID=2934157 RepID=UPI0035AFF34C